MQGRPRGAQVAIEFALAHQMGADEAAHFIADAFLKARRPPAAGAWHMVAAPSPRRPRVRQPRRRSGARVPCGAPEAHGAPALPCSCAGGLGLGLHPEHAGRVRPQGLLAAHHDPSAMEGAAAWASCDLVPATQARPAAAPAARAWHMGAPKAA